MKKKSIEKKKQDCLTQSIVSWRDPYPSERQNVPKSTARTNSVWYQRGSPEASGRPKCCEVSSTLDSAYFNKNSLLSSQVLSVSRNNACLTTYLNWDDKFSKLFIHLVDIQQEGYIRREFQSNFRWMGQREKSCYKIQRIIGSVE